MEGSCGKVVAVSVSEQRGQKKNNASRIELSEDFGIVGDGHAKKGDLRQVSLLAIESIENFIQKGIDVSPGDFAENITTRGMVLHELLKGTQLNIGPDVVLEITQIGKECISPCSIYNAVGDCIMPKVGIFAKVLKGGVISPDDKIRILE